MRQLPGDNVQLLDRHRAGHDHHPLGAGATDCLDRVVDPAQNDSSATDGGAHRSCVVEDADHVVAELGMAIENRTEARGVAAAAHHNDVAGQSPGATKVPEEGAGDRPLETKDHGDDGDAKQEQVAGHLDAGQKGDQRRRGNSRRRRMDEVTELLGRPLDVAGR